MDLWSDVFSSVLSDVRALEGLPFRDKAFIEKNDAPQMGKLRCAPPCGAKIDGALANRNRQIGISIRCHHRGRARQCARIDRQSVGRGKRVSVRVDLGGRRMIKKKQKTSL